MRSFLQKKAGATYFGDSAMTVNVRKRNMEYIFALNGGWHAVVSLLVTQEGVTVMANLGNITEQLSKIVPQLTIKPGEHKKFFDILEGKSEYDMITIDLGEGMTSGITKTLEITSKPHIQILGDPEVIKAANKLFEHVLEIYLDLNQSKYPDLKALTKFFYD